MANHVPIRKRPTGPGPTREIPDKLYFRIGEVAKLCEVPAYVLRFWEGEFPQLKPNKGGTGQRLYRRRDVEMALRIKTLLYDEGYTIPGARQAFKAELRAAGNPSNPPQADPDAPTQPVDASHLIALQRELRELHALLSKPAAARPAVRPIRGLRSVPDPEPLPQEPKAPPAPMQFPKPKLVATPRQTAREALVDSFVSSLFDNLPPEK